MTVQNTAALIEEFAQVSVAITNLIDRINDAVPPGLAHDGFAEALRGARMPESAVGEYSSALHSWRNSVVADLEDAARTCGAAQHVVHAAAAKARRYGGGTPSLPL